MNNNNQDAQKRVLMAVLLSFLFFIVYDEYILPKPAQQQISNKSQEIKPSQAAPNTTMTTQIGANQQEIKSSALVDNSKDIIATIEMVHSTITIDSLGRIDQVILKDTNLIDENGKQIELFKKHNILRPLEVRFANSDINKEALDVKYSANVANIYITNQAQKLVLTQKLSSHIITKELVFYPDGHYDINTSINADETFFITTGFRPDANVDKFVFHGALIKEFDDTITTIKDEGLESSVSFRNAKISAASDKYYTTSLYNLKNGINVVVDYDKDENPLIFIEGKKSLSLSGYVGSKDFERLANINPELTSIIEYGWFTFIAKPMFVALNYLNQTFNNWGWSIVVLTIILKFILFPLSYKGMMSMQKLKVLAPKIKELQAKHKGDAQKTSAAMMELYKKNDANPMGGCLPMILQIPVFFAIYRVLLNAVELKGAEWIWWIEDLALKDPYFVLPILMGATMFIQQIITPNTMTDPLQQKIFKWLPVVFTGFFMTFPAGLTLYWFINNLFSVIQQYYINYAFDKQRSDEIQAHHK